MIETQLLKGNLIKQEHSLAFTLNQYDKNISYKINLIGVNGNGYTLDSGDIVTIEWQKPNGQPFLQTSNIVKGDTYITLLTPEAISQIAGTGSYNIIITNGDTRKGTIKREYSVISNSMRTGTTSEDVIGDNIIELQALVNTVQTYDSRLAEKANEIDLQTQKARIDSFTTLAEGSTTGDAELIDARTINGKTYINIGDAIRAISNGEALANSSVDYSLLNKQTKHTTVVNPDNLFTNPLLIPNTGVWILSGTSEYQSENINGFNSIKLTKQESINSLFYESFSSYEKNVNYTLSCEYLAPVTPAVGKLGVFLYLKDTYVSQIYKNFDINTSTGKLEMTFTLPTDKTYDEIRVAFSNESNSNDTAIYFYKPLLLKEGATNRSFSLHETVEQIYSDVSENIKNKADEIVFNPNNLSGDKGEPDGWANLGDFCTLSSELIDNFKTLKCYSEGDLTIPFKVIEFPGGYTGDITSSLKIKVKPTDGVLPVNVKITHIVYTDGATSNGTSYKQSYSIYDSNTHTISNTINVTNCTRLHVAFEIDTEGFNCYINQLTTVKTTYAQKHSINSYFQENINGNNKLFESSISLNGDSITQGAGFGGGYGKLIAERNFMTYSNIAIGGGTITAETYMLPENYPNLTEPKARHWISRTIANMPIYNYNLVSGGINDYWNKVVLGEITPDYTSTLDDTTFTGGMESICKQMVTRFVGKKYGFIITHKINDTYYPYGSSNAGRFELYHDRMIEVLEKWSIPYLDLFKLSGFNSNIPELKAQYTNNGDGVHPNEEGYKYYYVDKIENWMLSL